MQTKKARADNGSGLLIFLCCYKCFLGSNSGFECGKTRANYGQSFFWIGVTTRGLQQLMPGARKFKLSEISRNEIFSDNLRYLSMVCKQNDQVKLKSGDRFESMRLLFQ